MEQIIFSPKSLGSAIKRQRKLKKLNQKETGSVIKIEQSTVSSVENGAAGTRLETLFHLIAALDLELVIRTKKNSKPDGNEDW